MGLAKSRAGLEAKGICISEAGHAALIGHFGSGSTIQLPLMREWRAVRYASDGTSNGEIATKLGLTESAVDKLFARLGGKPPRRPN